MKPSSILIAIVMSAAVCVAQSHVPPAAESEEPAAAPAAPPTFADWLSEVRSEAIARGIKAETVDRAFSSLETLPVVVERDRSQVEVVLSIEQYLARRLTRDLVRTAQRALRDQSKLLGRVEERYGVPAEILVSIWGLESNFGRFSGVRPTIAALATLAYDGRRAEFFRGELLDALTILDRGYIGLERLKGSWAGAMGQPQFMPSSYLRYAADFNEDGRRDIWTDHGDIFASIANYLTGYGWTRGERWGRAVRVTKAGERRVENELPSRTAGCGAMRRMPEPQTLLRWRTIGVTLPDGRPLPAAPMDASLVRTEKRSFLVYRNYDALLGYNCAHTYALAVALLADRISS
jgi:membrane-bound lytic murein transglycosylase B